jgi:hypothetical protein
MIEIDFWGFLAVLGLGCFIGFCLATLLDGIREMRK